MDFKQLFIAALALLPAQQAVAKKASSDEIEALNQCILSQAMSGDENRTMKEVRQYCEQQIGGLSQLDKRIARERVTEENRNVLTPHHRNYILPVSYIKNPNNRPFNRFMEKGDQEGEPLDNVEAKYQISLKLPLYHDFEDKDQAIYMGVTLQSYWQVYNKDISSPFRETNYEPEIFWINFLDDENVLWGDEMAFVLGISHQSNGRSQPNSRSWNRIYANFIWEYDGFVFSFKPWYRLPEDDKPEPNSAKGDDNPDIHKYMGYFELSGAYRFNNDHEVGMMLRNNAGGDNRGAVQLDWSFPITGRVRGYAQYFNGYGESLIDYDAHIQRLGIGIAITDLL
ncbi:phospholipase A [Pseudoalteromonas luteoviolacea]|uniref:phospholipase A n=1 Tax=Pseudoalteromonas luteoviolacea TaxID=43657 RepID=UPI00115110B9|nr:phospholipase A [Pseudoalteromonas luteoviolacea]TQF72372.1 phospholipase A [Pseudoalteromonas luteoviolacea]